MRLLYLAPAALGLLAVLSGCATTYDAAWPPPRPLGDAVSAYHPPQSPASADSLVARDPSPEGVLTLREVLALALLHNPDLRAFGWEVRAREAHTLQAGLPPNPEIGTDLENFAGGGPVSGTDAAELTVGLSQLIELGGDRRRRRDVAALERDLAGWDYETVRLDVLTETAQAFTDLLAAQQRMLLADSLSRQAELFYESVAARVEAGKVSALEERRAQVVRSTAAIQRERAARELAAARVRLSATWGRTDPTFERVVGDLSVVVPPPPMATLEAFVERNPDVARWSAEMALRRANVALEKARRIPNPSLLLGVRRLRDLGETALTTGVSIPLSIFDRNQGAIREAEYRLRQGEELRRSEATRARRMLAEAYALLAAAYGEVRTLREAVLPAARENFAATQEGYREGKFDLLTVLDAQRILFETTNQYVDALAAYHAARAEVERLIGTPLSDVSNQ
ncbi:TolC family protein [Rhodocaloribacter litoris]|uniref:TolC family protein n=1 Tax=Rhodocaloribacter litoris TaxID=2558931 RepID=UPI00141D9243|nr:TolC family protein [Rhodocaloribacter litoris]QXD13790.1 TolC family protein [Rhodocaloribacter litoris]